MKIYSYHGRKNMIGEQIRAARLRGKTTVSQQDLSARLAVMGVILDRTAISKIESGERLVTDYEVFALSKALNVSLDWLFGLKK